MRTWKAAGATALLLGSTVPALAQMMPGGAWQGFYVGLNVGGAWSNPSVSLTPTGCFATPGGCGLTAGGGPGSRSFSSSTSSSGPLGGVQAGYNWQLAPLWVVGLETDFDGGGVNHSRSSTVTLPAPLTGSATLNTSTSQDFIGTVRGRIGLTPAPEWLIFGTGGFAYGQFSSSANLSFSRAGDVYSGSTSNMRTGWAAGGGVEWAIAPQWSLKAEYLYVDLGASGGYNVNITNPAISGVNPGAGFHANVSSNENIFRLGVNYHFAPPPPPPPPMPVEAPPPPPPPLPAPVPAVRG